MQPQDIGLLALRRSTRWNRFISQLFPSANILRTGVLINEDVGKVTTKGEACV